MVPERVRPYALALISLAIFALIQGLYAAYLNKLFYSIYAPFYDSMDYLDHLAKVLQKSHKYGITAGLKEAVSRSTVILPYLVGLALSPFLHLSRIFGVWIQLPWLYCLLVSAFFFCRLVLKASFWVAAILALPFTSIAAIYNYDGGLSDFRMDLHLYLLYGCSILWFLIAVRKRRLSFWIVSGLFGGLTALARTTAPIYFFVTIVPIVLIHLASDFKNWPFFLKGIVCWSCMFILISGWFYLITFDHLYYYYFIWNADANAHLPLSQSIQHFEFAWNSLGWPITISAFLALFFSFPFEKARKPFSSYLASFQWESLIVALAPAGFLTLRGAGVNPFVAMPSALGFILAILSLRGSWENLSKIQTVFITLLILGGVLWSASEGIENHSHPLNYTHKMEGYRTLLGLIETDASSHFKRPIKIVDITVGYFNATVLMNILIFDQSFKIEEDSLTKGEEIFNFSYPEVYPAATKIDWLKNNGSNDQERIKNLVERTQKNFTYAVFPTAQTAEYLKNQLGFYYINNYSEDLEKEMLSDGKWTRISDPISMTQYESYELYRNDALINL